MPADDSHPPRFGGFEGFHSFADDTPRPPEPAGATEGDADLRLDPRQRARTPRIAWRPVMVAGGVIAALTVGAVLAVGGPSAERAESAIGTPLPVEVAEVKPPQPPPPSDTAPLVVLPETGDRPTIDLAPDVPLPAPRAPAEPAAAPEPELKVERAEPRTPELAVTGVPASVATMDRPRRDPCAGAPSPAAEMVCRDPDLAAADRRMRRAYDAAVAAGAPEDMLAFEQADWREIREMAARRSPRAVASIYRQRTDELWRMADEGWR